MAPNNSNPQVPGKPTGTGPNLVVTDSGSDPEVAKPSSPTDFKPGPASTGAPQTITGSGSDPGVSKPAPATDFKPGASGQAATSGVKTVAKKSVLGDVLKVGEKVGKVVVNGVEDVGDL